MDYLRQEIDGIDKELLELFQKRMKTEKQDLSHCC